MQTPVEITWRGLDPIQHIANRIDERVARLERRFGRITRCHVVVEKPHQRHLQGNLYEVRIDATTPGGEMTVTRRPGDMNAHADLKVAIRDSFDAMERQLGKWKQRHSGRPEAHATPLQGRVKEIDHAAGSGQIAATDGRLVYFHRNSLIAGDFDDLAAGDAVELAVDPGEDAAGAHASAVRPISAQRFVDAPD